MLGDKIDPKVLNEFNRRRKGIKKGIAYITSNKAGFNSYGIDGRGGYFTEYLLKGLEEGLADTDQDKIITVDEIFTYVKTEVSRKAKNAQVPEIYHNLELDMELPVMLLPKAKK